ncbi:hypothetical protein Ahy_B03g064121 [Arachis hypogaea]|uniref:Aminotransferase-like plant mobile domain-containing protein n=1 Tax=Arachis hypogaea TaxID=3818 RepID=A0A444ZYV0_ARAHY|nr:hypothetical protein Ahy_B03g064121 [Arachis hypogaea]
MVHKLDPPKTWNPMLENYLLGLGLGIRDAESLDTEESIKRYVRCQIFCLLGSILFTDKWSHSYKSSTWLSKTVSIFRQEIDYMDEGSNFLTICGNFCDGRTKG